MTLALTLVTRHDSARVHVFTFSLDLTIAARFPSRATDTSQNNLSGDRGTVTRSAFDQMQKITLR